MSQYSGPNIKHKGCRINVLTITVSSFLTRNVNQKLNQAHNDYVFYIHGSVHRDSLLIRSSEMHQYAGVYLLENYSTCFGCLLHPSSGAHQTVAAASGTGHSVRATTFRQCGLNRPR